MTKIILGLSAFYHDSAAALVQDVLREDREPGLVGGPEGAPAGGDREDDERQREETDQGERLPSRGRCRRRDQLSLDRPVGDPISMLGVTSAR